MNKNTQLLLNSLSGTGLYGVNVVVAFIMSPFYIAVLGNRHYGLWEIAMSVMGYMGLLDLGIGSALVRFVAVADGSEDRADLQKTVSTAFAFFIIIGCVATLAFFALGISPELVTGKESKDIARFGTVFLLIGVNVGIMFPLLVFTATLMGRQRYYIINNSRIILTVARAVIAYFLLKRFQGNGLIIMALLEPIFTAIQFVLFAGVLFYDEKVPRFALKAVSKEKAKEMIIFGAKSAPMQIASRVVAQSVPLIIGKVLGLNHVVYFIMPNRLIDYARGLSLSIGAPLIPYFSAAVGRNDKDELLNSWLQTTLAMQIFAAAMPVVILFCGEVFLRLWLGAEYAEAGRYVIYLLLLGLVAQSVAVNALRLLTALGKHGTSTMAWLILSILSVPVAVLGAKHWGVPGATIGLAMTVVLGNFISLYFACSMMHITVVDYLRKTIFRLAFPLLFLTVMLSFCKYVMPVMSYLQLVLHLLISGSIYLLAVWAITLDKNIRKRIVIKSQDTAKYFWEMYVKKKGSRNNIMDSRKTNIFKKILRYWLVV